MHIWIIMLIASSSVGSTWMLFLNAAAGVGIGASVGGDCGIAR
jgi:hypothetical protein